MSFLFPKTVFQRSIFTVWNIIHGCRFVVKNWPTVSFDQLSIMTNRYFWPIVTFDQSLLLTKRQLWPNRITFDQPLLLEQTVNRQIWPAVNFWPTVNFRPAINPGSGFPASPDIWGLDMPRVCDIPDVTDLWHDPGCPDAGVPDQWLV